MNDSSELNTIHLYEWLDKTKAIGIEFSIIDKLEAFDFKIENNHFYRNSIEYIMFQAMMNVSDLIICVFLLMYVAQFCI